MNLYFLVEGYTESDFYPKILDYYFDGKLTKVDRYDLALSNNYHIVGNGGYPYIYTGPKTETESSSSLKNSILEINDNPVYDYLIVCLDADDATIEYRQEELNGWIDKFRKQKVVLNSYCQLKLIVQNRCIETWFLGNKSLFKKNPAEEPLISYVKYYNVKTDDPELMGTYIDEYTYQAFHHLYLRELFRERKLSYKKGITDVVGDGKYIEALKKRASERGGHIQSMNELFVFLDQAKSKII